MGHRKKGAGLKRLAELVGTEPPKKDVLKVEAVPIDPIREPIRPVSSSTFSVIDPIDEEDDEVILPFFGSMGRAPKDMKCVIRSEGEDGYKDQRGFSYAQQDGKWNAKIMIVAGGNGPVPHGIKTLGVMRDLFNFAFNHLLGGRIVNQDVEQSSSPPTPALPPPDEPMHLKVLGYLKGERDKPC
jgi:hypothetical protein